MNPPKLLLDENLSPAIALTLAQEGVDVVHVRDRGLLQATDAVVFGRALAEDRMVVTSNVDDFAKLARGATVHAGLILFEDSGLLCAAMGLVILAGSCNSNRGDQELARRISAAAQTSDISVVVLPELAPFGWDRLFVFSPYTTSSRVEESLGFSWSDSSRIEARDDIALLVFVSSGRVIRFVDQSRGGGDFSDCDRPGGYSRAAATFRFTKDASGWRRCSQGGG